MNTTENSAAKYVIREYVTKLRRFNEAISAYDQHQEAQLLLEQLIRDNGKKLKSIGEDVMRDISKAISSEKDLASFVCDDLVRAASLFITAADELEKYTGITADAATYMRAFSIARSDA